MPGSENSITLPGKVKCYTITSNFYYLDAKTNLSAEQASPHPRPWLSSQQAQAQSACPPPAQGPPSSGASGVNSQRIQAILRHGQRLETRYATLMVQPMSQGAAEVACVVGKKVHVSSVVRHRYQRLLRAAARPLIQAGLKYDMVMVAKPEILSVKNLHELEDVFETHFRHLM